MAQLLEMPKLSDTMEEGGIAKWLKKEGDFVKEGEPLLEIETDKATQEYESPMKGVLVKILVQPGNSAALRAPLAIFGDKGESVDVDSFLKEIEKPEETKSEEAPSPTKTSAPASAETQAVKTPPSPTAANVSGGRIKASPLAKRLAEQHGINLSTLSGTGPSGRIVMKDIETAVAQGGGAAAARRAVVTGKDQTIPVSMMRKTIAKRLLAAKNDAPHFYLTVSANMQAMMAWRARLNKEAQKSDGQLPKVSVNDLVVMACAKALRQHPNINASWQGDHILQYGDVHVAVAVALPEGLVTPVIRHTDQMSVRDIAAASKDLVTKAKSGKLGNEDYAGGSFTISNLGMFGIEEFTAIINPPQAGILAVGATIKQPWVDENGQLTVQDRMKVTMSCDHRVIDGAAGSQFLQTLVRYLEDPLAMLS